MPIEKARANLVFGVLSSITFAAAASADLLLVQDATFHVQSDIQILADGGPFSDAHNQSGDQNDNPFNGNVAAETSIPGELTLNSSAQLSAAWGASNISANGEADFHSSGQLSSGQFVNLGGISTLTISFQVQTDATYELNGQLFSSIHFFGNSSEIVLRNSDSSAILHELTSAGPFSFSGTLLAGVNYQLQSDANLFLPSFSGVLENLDAQFDLNMELTAVPAPGAFGLFVLSGIIGRPKRRR